MNTHTTYTDSNPRHKVLIRHSPTCWASRYLRYGIRNYWLKFLLSATLCLSPIPLCSPFFTRIGSQQLQNIYSSSNMDFGASFLLYGEWLPYFITLVDIGYVSLRFSSHNIVHYQDTSKVHKVFLSFLWSDAKQPNVHGHQFILFVVVVKKWKQNYCTYIVQIYIFYLKKYIT